MRRKANVLGLAFVLICSVALSASDQGVGSAHPNILFIAVDDLKPILGCYGDEAVITPNIDRLAQSGMLFTNAYCQQAVCTASRSSLLTGLYPDSTQVWDLKTKIRDINPEVVTLPQYFRQHGYTTQAIGKVFDNRNVDEAHDKASWSVPHQSPDIHTPAQYADPAHYQAMDALRQSSDEELTEGKLKKQGLLPPTETYPAPDSAYPDGQIAQLGVQALQDLSQSSQPFFLAVGFLRPHLPFAAPERFWRLYDRDQFEVPKMQTLPEGGPHFAYQDSWELRWNYSGLPKGGIPIEVAKQKELIHGYYACASFVDSLIGQVLEALDQEGLRDNTIIVLWGDHGWHLGDHGMWGKHTNYEQATRAPLIMSGPGIAQGRSSSPVEFVDIYPTLCALSELPIPQALQGVSLLPVLRAPEARVHFAAQSQFPRTKGTSELMGYTYRSDRYRYTEWRDSVSGEIVSREFFDYEADPAETRNLIGEPQYAAAVENFKNHLTQK